MVTNYPALPKGTQQVEVVFDGLDPMTVDGHAGRRCHRSISRAPVPANPTFWRLRRSDPPPGWKTDEWPPPVPRRAQLEQLHRHGGPAGALSNRT